MHAGCVGVESWRGWRVNWVVKISRMAGVVVEVDRATRKTRHALCVLTLLLSERNTCVSPHQPTKPVHNHQAIMKTCAENNTMKDMLNTSMHSIYGECTFLRYIWEVNKNVLDTLQNSSRVSLFGSHKKSWDLHYRSKHRKNLYFNFGELWSKAKPRF